jgi:hypothetical protein
MMALNKPICFLRDETLHKFPSDLVGKLSIPFDTEEMSDLGKELRKWVNSHPLFAEMSAIRKKNDQN